MDIEIITNIIGYIASCLVALTFFMKTMIPLRKIAIASNIAFITFGTLESIYPIVILHLFLLPLNIFRLQQIYKLLKMFDRRQNSDPNIEKIIPYMKPVYLGKGQVVFKKGEDADRMFYLDQGQVEIEEKQICLKVGDVFGEMSLFSDKGKRDESVLALTDCKLYYITRGKFNEVITQTPSLGPAILGPIVESYLQKNKTINNGELKENQELYS